MYRGDDTSDSGSGSNSDYELGDGEDELARLDLRGLVLAPAMRMEQQ